MAESFWVTLGIAVIGAVPGVLALILKQRQVKAEADSSEVDTADKLVEMAMGLNAPMKARIAEQDLEISSMRTVIKEKDELISNQESQLSGLREESRKKDEAISRLVHQIKSLNAVPVWDPQKENDKK